MITNYIRSGAGLLAAGEGAPHEQAIWIDLCCPTGAEAELVEALGVTVPGLPDMEQIEISRRLCRTGGFDCMTAMLPGQCADARQASMPVTFILGPDRLVSVRHHAPRAFETFAGRAGARGASCATAAHVFLGLVEEIIGRQADHLEGAGRAIDAESRALLQQATCGHPQMLRGALAAITAQGEGLGQVRLGLGTLDRVVAHFGHTLEDRPETRVMRTQVRTLQRDLQSLEVHADFLSARLSQVGDAALGMAGLAQAAALRALLGVAVLAAPPMLVAAVCVAVLRPLTEFWTVWSCPLTLGLMVLSACLSWAIARWKNLL